MSEYNLKQSLAKVGQLYPVLVASDGEIIDGHHRLRARDDWQRIKLPHIKSNAEKYAARIIANLCRRDVSKKEKREWVTGLAEELRGGGVDPGKIVQEIAQVTGMSDYWVRTYLPDRFKERRKAGQKSEAVQFKLSVMSEVKDEVEDVLDDVRRALETSPESAVTVASIMKHGLSSLEKQVKSLKTKDPRENAHIVSEIDTGFLFTCPTCQRRFQLIHAKPSGTHKFRELRGTQR